MVVNKGFLQKIDILVLTVARTTLAVTLYWLQIALFHNRATPNTTGFPTQSLDLR